MICSRCGVDQPDDAFSEVSLPLCRVCFRFERQEITASSSSQEGAAAPPLSTRRDDDDEYFDEDDEMDETADETQEDEEAEKTDKQHKRTPLAGAVQIVATRPSGDVALKERISSDTEEPPDMSRLLEPLVDIIEQRGYADGFGLDSRAVLKWRLQRVVFDTTNPVISWLTRPLVDALLYDSTTTTATATTEALTSHNPLRVRVAPMGMSAKVMEAQTLLHWVVQWRLLCLQCGWRGHDDVVELLLRAILAAQRDNTNRDEDLINARLSNGCTPLFFAVKYGSVDTVQLLLQAGADVHVKDVFGQSCLRNALPRPSPYILQVLFQHRVSVRETFPAKTIATSKTETNSNRHHSNNNNSSSTCIVRINALDVLVTEFVAPTPDVSWVTLGMPDMEDYAHSMVLLMKRGLFLSHNTSYYPDAMYYLGHYLQGSVQAQKRSYYTTHIADLLLGHWLPPRLQEDVMVYKERVDIDDDPLLKVRSSHLSDSNTVDKRRSVEFAVTNNKDTAAVANNSITTAESPNDKVDKNLIGESITETNEPAPAYAVTADKEGGHPNKETTAFTCSLCRSQHHEPPKPNSSKITLYCGHSFCPRCLLAYAAHDNLRPGRAACPACHRPLAGIFAAPDHSNHVLRYWSLEKQSTATEELEKRLVAEERWKSTQSLTEEQLAIECDARNLVLEEGVSVSASTYFKALQYDWNDFVVPRVNKEEEDDDDDDDTNSSDAEDDDEEDAPRKIMVEIGASQTMVSERHLWVAPVNGCAAIPICVKGIPVLAFLSTSSPYTVVSPKFVETFGLVLNPHLEFTASNYMKMKSLMFYQEQKRIQREEEEEFGFSHNTATPSSRKDNFRASKAKQVHLACVENFSFLLGTCSNDDNCVHVHLKNTVVQAFESDSKTWPVGVVLGLDFFASAAWTQLAVEVDLEECLGRTVALLSGGSRHLRGMEFDMLEPCRAAYVEEELRYYAHDGKTFRSPLWHVYPTENDAFLSLAHYFLRPPQRRPPKEGRLQQTSAESSKSQSTTIRFTECAWCCRTFPSTQDDQRRTWTDWLMSRPVNRGMVSDEPWSGQTRLGSLRSPEAEEPIIYYCDNRCQETANSVRTSADCKGLEPGTLGGADFGKRVPSNGRLWMALLVFVAIPLAFWILTNEEGVGREPTSLDQSHEL